MKKISWLLTAIVVLSLMAIGCGGPPPVTTFSHTYNGKDVLGNSYSFSLGTNARSAKKGDRFSMDLKTRDGKTRWVKGQVHSINADGTITVKPDGGGDLFDVVVSGNTLTSVSGTEGESVEIDLKGDKKEDDMTFSPRTFDNIHLRANRWDGDTAHGEDWSSWSVFLTDFPSNVSYFQPNRNHYGSRRYSVAISGVTDKDLNNFAIDIFGLIDNDDWAWLSGNEYDYPIKAGTFNVTIPLDIWGDEDRSLNFMDYKEIILNVNNVINHYSKDGAYPDRIYGAIPDDVDDWQIMATIKDLKISLIDDERAATLGNAGDYTFGYKEDGLSVAYQQAVWKIPNNQIANAKKAGAKFEFIMNGVEDISDGAPVLAFIWQDPASGLWWQDMTTISAWDEDESIYKVYDGVEWDPDSKKVSITLSDIIKDNKFATAKELNFIVACWYMNDNSGENFENIFKNIDVFDIQGANIN